MTTNQLYRALAKYVAYETKVLTYMQATGITIPVVYTKNLESLIMNAFQMDVEAIHAAKCGCKLIESLTASYSEKN